MENAIKKKLYQSGKEYINVRGKKVEAKRINNTKHCLNKCKLKCASKIGESNRREIFKYYYELSQNEKYVFLKQNTEKYFKARKTKELPSRQQYSFKYSFKIHEEKEKVNVCKVFFLGTLDISQKPIYTAHSVEGDTPKKT